MTAGLQRSFRDLSDKDFAIADSLGPEPWNRAGDVGWSDLLKAWRILIVSEAGVGKIYECRACQQRLWDGGEGAFFLELATLADEHLRDMLTAEECDRFDAWLKAQSEVATFFLDSIDELKISQRSFEHALKRLGRALAGNLGRARIVITTRPIPIDRELIEKHLPFPSGSEAMGSPERFADIVMRKNRNANDDNKSPRAWRNVGLLPLTREQIKVFAEGEGVVDADLLLADIERRHAEDYALRPLDLIELCSDWKEYRRIRSHFDQVTTNVANKLKSRSLRDECAQLSDDRAMEGASRLALAALLTRKLTLRYSAEADRAWSADAALDVGKILTDWSQPERDTLLERALFGFANYGRVRFHHRSVLEFLAAKRLEALLKRGVPVRSIKRMLFAEVLDGSCVVRPSLRPVAGWLSLWNDAIFDEVLKREPEILLSFGDPGSLSPIKRGAVIRAYVYRYGDGGWRGLNVPVVQVQRIASSDLEPVVLELLVGGVENLEVRLLLIGLIGFAGLTGCADTVYCYAIDRTRSHAERIEALDALLALDDMRLLSVAESIEGRREDWPCDTVIAAVWRLFPKYLSVQQLAAILPTVQEPTSSIGCLSWRLPQVISNAPLSLRQVDDLRQCLTMLVTDGAEWRDEEGFRVRTRRPDLVAALLAACNRQFSEESRTTELFRSSIIALRLAAEDDFEGGLLSQLRCTMDQASSSERERAFWDDHAFLQTLRPAKDAWARVFMLSHYGGIRLTWEKDRDWIVCGLSDTQRAVFEREMLLWAGMIEVLPPGEDVRKSYDDLKRQVVDAPELVAIIEDRLKPVPVSKGLKRLEDENRRRQRKSERDHEKARASWVSFWKEIADHPDDVFADDRAESTAWSLWHAMERSGDNSRAVGWNRRFIEREFGQNVADRLRATLVRMWRKDRPTLRSERPTGEKNTFLVKWQLGLAAIYAEAEDPNWTTGLTDEEAALAARFAPIELNGFPSWLDGLVSTHSEAVDSVLGVELTLALRDRGEDSDPTMFLQNIRHATPRLMATFAPRIWAWLKEVSVEEFPTDGIVLRRLAQALDILMHVEDQSYRRMLRELALRIVVGGIEAPIAKVWLPILIQLDPEAGVETLEAGLEEAAVSQSGAGVYWFSTLFGGAQSDSFIELRHGGFTPTLLLRLVRLAYRHVRPTDDAQHVGSYSPDERDYAEQGRNALVGALLATNGSEGWAVKQEMASDPAFEHFKDRVLAVARERAAEDTESLAIDEVEVAALDAYGELLPSTRDEMFAVMRDRLDDIDDLLMRDESPREMWASVVDEKVMRRALAHELRMSRNYMYTVDQEGATADEKETDIRLRATRSSQQAVIELKIGEKPRTAKDLSLTIKDQLVNKYMGPDECRAGCLLITLGKNRTWGHPTIKGKRLEFQELIAWLQSAANLIASDLGGGVRLLVKGLDLRPRLTTEKRAKTVRKRTSSSRRSTKKVSKSRVVAKCKVSNRNA